MKLTELLEQCESEDSAVCLKAKQRLRYHAAEVLPDLIRRLKTIAESGHVMKSDVLRGIAAEGLRIAEEVKDHSEQLTPDTKPQTVMMP